MSARRDVRGSWSGCVAWLEGESSGEGATCMAAWEKAEMAAGSCMLGPVRGRRVLQTWAKSFGEWKDLVCLAWCVLARLKAEQQLVGKASWAAVLGLFGARLGRFARPSLVHALWA